MLLAKGVLGRGCREGINNGFDTIIYSHPRTYMAGHSAPLWIQPLLGVLMFI